MNEKDRFTRRRVTEALVAATLVADTVQPWPPTEPLSAHDIERLVHWGEGEDSYGRPYGNYQGVRERIFQARERQQSIAPILEQLRDKQTDIHPSVLCEHLLDILTVYDHGERLTLAERETIRDIVTAWPPEFEPHGHVRTRIALVDSIVSVAPVMRELLITETTLSKEELTRFNQG